MAPTIFPKNRSLLVILNALDDNPLPVYDKGDQISDVLYVEDHARALYRELKWLPQQNCESGIFKTIT